jgi:hypothetical protein
VPGDETREPEQERSSNQKNNAHDRRNDEHATVVWIVSSRVGHTTLRSSMRAPE